MCNVPRENINLKRMEDSSYKRYMELWQLSHGVEIYVPKQVLRIVPPKFDDREDSVHWPKYIKLRNLKWRRIYRWKRTRQIVLTLLASLFVMAFFFTGFILLHMKFPAVAPLVSLFGFFTGWMGVITGIYVYYKLDP